MLARPYRSVMSWFYMRMQPYDTKPPIELGSLVPWMAYSPPDSVSAAAPIGLPGEPPSCPRALFGRARAMSGAGCQAGFTYLPLMIERPAHWRPARPTPTG